jgi:hypothetical protein
MTADSTTVTLSRLILPSLFLGQQQMLHANRITKTHSQSLLMRLSLPSPGSPNLAALRYQLLVFPLCSVFWVKAENEGLALQRRTHRSFKQQIPSSISFCSNGCYTTQRQMPTELSNPCLNTYVWHTYICASTWHRLSTTSWLATYASPQQPMLGPIYTCTRPFRLLPCDTI